jgi:hypothetical protein
MHNLLLPQREFIERQLAVRFAVVSGRKPDMTADLLAPEQLALLAAENLVV